ncbi:MAG TPA: hypothetical protein VFJ23_08390 [Candidatus Nitrosotalea sp.]|nr:hypothetical protein [Candidatus Nitrosotalea sp.]
MDSNDLILTSVLRSDKQIKDLHNFSTSLVNILGFSITTSSTPFKTNFMSVNVSSQGVLGILNPY